MTKRSASKPQKMWAVLRDDKIYLIKPTKLHARHERDHYNMDGFSQHAWTVKPVFVRLADGEAGR